MFENKISEKMKQAEIDILKILGNSDIKMYSRNYHQI